MHVSCIFGLKSSINQKQYLRQSLKSRFTNEIETSDAKKKLILMKICSYTIVNPKFIFIWQKLHMLEKCSYKIEFKSKICKCKNARITVWYLDA